MVLTTHFCLPACTQIPFNSTGQYYLGKEWNLEQEHQTLNPCLQFLHIQTHGCFIEIKKKDSTEWQISAKRLQCADRLAQTHWILDQRWRVARHGQDQMEICLNSQSKWNMTRQVHLVQRLTTQVTDRPRVSENLSRELLCLTKTTASHSPPRQRNYWEKKALKIRNFCQHPLPVQ